MFKIHGDKKECIIHLIDIFSFELLMEYDTSEISKYIQIAKEKHKEGNLHQANEIYKKLINQKIYTYDLLISYGLFNREINNLKIAKNLFFLIKVNGDRKECIIHYNWHLFLLNY